MRPESGDLGKPADWLRHAKSDLSVAAQPAGPDTLRETLAFHAQQSVEKSIKAVLLHKGVRFPYTHSIARLITLLNEAHILWPGELDEAAGLTEYAVATRYPGIYPDISEDDLRRAVQLARDVLRWAERIVCPG